MNASRSLGRVQHWKPSGFGRHTTPILWTLHGWVTMFFVGAAYAKLTEPMELLTLLMAWPAMMRPEVVRAVGWVELILAAALFSSLLIDSRVARVVALTTSTILTLNAVAMLVFYVLRLDLGLALTNAALILLGVGILLGHRTVVRA